jgi:hypothetical protein
MEILDIHVSTPASAALNNAYWPMHALSALRLLSVASQQNK